jgi:hypothetical protein
VSGTVTRLGLEAANRSVDAVEAGGVLSRIMEAAIDSATDCDLGKLAE